MRRRWQLTLVAWACSALGAQAQTIALTAGWNLLGNGSTTPINVADSALFGDAGKVASVWKWLPASGKWAIYRPSLSSQALSSYAAGNGYEVLSAIAGGEGFWVNASTGFTVTLPSTPAMSTSTVQSALAVGWNLIAIGETKNPGDFDVTSLWTWDSAQSAWYFYARSLNASGGLAAQVQNRGYLDFTAASKRLEPGMGFWVNKPAASSLAAPTNVSVGASGSQAVGGQTISSSTRLSVAWTAPGYTVHHYEITASEALQNTQVSTTSNATTVTLSGLKALTPYAVTVRSCADAECARNATAAAVSATTPGEYWQLQGTGSSTAGLTRIVSDGNARISATRIGSDAGTSTAGKIQLYYGPNGQTSQRQALSTALAASVASATTPGSYLSFSSSAASTGLISPATAAPAVQQIATGQGVPLSAALGSKIRLFFEASGSDNKTRIYYLDSQDGYVGQDFNSGAPITCATMADYSNGGGCLPNLAIGVDGDAVHANSRISNARQFKLGFPILADWRWDGAAGTFMVFTTDSVSGCSSVNMNHGYAVWDGSNWVVQYAANGCPKLFTSAQAAFPMHLGGVRYKLYYGDPSLTTGRLGTSLPFLGPKKLIYADGTVSGLTTRVDFEDWESQAQARNVVFLWPSGSQLDDSAEGYIDDYHFLAPTGSLDLQVMYLAITNGSEIPFGAAAVLLNP